MEKFKKIFENKRIKFCLIIPLLLCAIVFVVYGTNIYNRNIAAKKNHIITKEISKMNNYHVLHSSILLNNGNVLILGGLEGYDNAEIYYAKSKRFKIIKKQILTGICSATLLPNGHVIIIGGKGIIDFNPNDNLFVLKNSNFKRILTKSIYLNNNKILIAGGIDEKTGKPAKKCVIYNLMNNKIENILTLISPNKNNNISSINNNTNIQQLSNNKILIKNQNNILLYDLTKRKILSKKISPYEQMRFTPIVINKKCILVLYKSSKINKLYFGYYDFIANKIIRSKEKQFINDNFIITKISDNLLLLTGVSTDNSTSNKGIFIFNTQTDELNFIGNMRYDRFSHQCTLLNNKTVLITGGASTKHLTNAQKTAEIFNF